MLYCQFAGESKHLDDSTSDIHTKLNFSHSLKAFNVGVRDLRARQMPERAAYLYLDGRWRHGTHYHISEVSNSFFRILCYIEVFFFEVPDGWMHHAQWACLAIFVRGHETDW